MKLKGCTTRRWPSVFAASRDFSTKFPYLKIQSLILNPFTDKNIDIAHHMGELRFYLVKMFIPIQNSGGKLQRRTLALIPVLALKSCNYCKKSLPVNQGSIQKLVSLLLREWVGLIPPTMVM